MKIEKMTLEQATRDMMASSAYAFGKVLAVFPGGWEVLEASAEERGHGHLIQQCTLKGNDVTLIPILGRYSYGFDIEVPDTEGSRSVELTLREVVTNGSTRGAISTVKAFAVIDLQSLADLINAPLESGMPPTFDAGDASTDELISFLTANDSMVEAVALELAIRLQGVRKHPKLLEQATLLCSE